MISKEVKFLMTHSSIYGLGAIVSRIVSFLLLPLYTRYLTPADYGVLETVEISNGVLGVVVTVGIAMALSRFYYEPDEKKGRNLVVSTTFITYVLVGLCCLPILMSICTPLSVWLFDTEEYGYYFRIGFAILLIGALLDIGMVYLRLIKKPTIFISITLSRLVILISLNILFIVHFGLGVLGILYSSLIVKSVYGLVMISYILRATGVRFSPRLSREMLKYSLPMIPSKLANTFVKQSDKYFVLHFLGTADMGIYSLALKLGNAVHNLLTIPFNLAYIPRRFEIMKQPDATNVYSRIFTYYVFFIGYVGLCISLLLPEILDIMVTDEFERAGAFVPAVVFYMIVYGCHFHFNFGILHSKKTKYLAYINLSSALLLLILNYFLIQTLGLWGGVLSLTVAMSLQAFLLYSVSNRLFPIRFQFGRVFGFFALCIAYYLTFSHLPIADRWLDFSARVLSLMLLPGILILFRIVSREEVAGMKHIVGERLNRGGRKKEQIETAEA